MKTFFYNYYNFLNYLPKFSSSSLLASAYQEGLINDPSVHCQKTISSQVGLHHVVSTESSVVGNNMGNRAVMARVVFHRAEGNLNCWGTFQLDECEVTSFELGTIADPRQ